MKIHYAMRLLPLLFLHGVPLTTTPLPPFIKGEGGVWGQGVVTLSLS
jgi:hypothetical protein